MVEDISTGWQIDFWVGNCPACDWTYLLQSEASSVTCPHCYRAELNALTSGELPPGSLPELIVPFCVPDDRVAEQIGDFMHSFRFAPTDLELGRLRYRLHKVYVPTWLVDSKVIATWRAEVGYDYQVVSHRESYGDAGWITEEVNETRIRWEPRVGRLERQYENVQAPAIEEINKIGEQLGQFELDKMTVYDPTLIESAMIRLPSRDPVDAWPDTQPRFKELAAAECCRATAADHIRQFSWQAQFDRQQWGLLLLPIYSTWYCDDEGRRLPIVMNGQSGRLAGLKRGSMKKARRYSIILTVLAGLSFLFMLALLASEPDYVPMAGIATLFLALLCTAPVVYVSQFNRRQKLDLPFSIVDQDKD